MDTPAHLFVIAKNKDDVSYYTYQRPGIETYIISDTCIHLKPFTPKIKGDFWSSLLLTDIWTVNPYIHKELKTIKDSLVTTHVISDGDEHDFYFITKNRIRKQYFYAPGFYNTYRPDKSLQTALKAIGLLNGIFRY